MSTEERPPLKPGLCTVCHHPSLAEIDRHLMNGMSLRLLAALYGLSPSALSRHTKHLRQALAAQEDEEERAKLAAWLDELDLMKTRLDRLFRKAEDDHSLHISLGCIQESLKILSLRARLNRTLRGRF